MWALRAAVIGSVWLLAVALPVSAAALCVLVATFSR